jgi:RNA polymerase sigma-70 factor (ECF subfamily)
MADTRQDLSLMQRLAAGDQQALRVLYMKYQLPVHRFIVRITNNAGVAEELANEVFLEVWRNAGAFQALSAPYTWILSIARNKAFGALRRRREFPLGEGQEDETPDEAFDPEALLVISDKAEVLGRCIAALSPEHRSIIDLVYYHELSVAETSEVTGLPEGTVKTRLFNARKKLSHLLAAAGVERGWP